MHLVSINAQTVMTLLDAFKASTSNSVAMLLATTPEWYLPHGVSRSDKNTEGTWDVEINACLRATNTCRLGINTYPVANSIEIRDGDVLEGQNRARSKIVPKAGFAAPLISIANASDWSVEKLTLDGLCTRPDVQNMLISGNISNGYVGRVNTLNASSSGTTVRSVGIHYIGGGKVLGLVFEDCYASQDVAAPSALQALHGIGVGTAGATPPDLQGVVFRKCRVNGKNMKQCLFIDGLTVSDCEFDGNQTWDSDFTGILFGYNAIGSTKFNSKITNNIGWNHGGSAVYANGAQAENDANIAHGLLISGNIADSCGGALSDQFACAFACVIRQVTMEGNYAINTGFTKNGVAREFEWQAIGFRLGRGTHEASGDFVFNSNNSIGTRHGAVVLGGNMTGTGNVLNATTGDALTIYNNGIDITDASSVLTGNFLSGDCALNAQGDGANTLLATGNTMIGRGTGPRAEVVRLSGINNGILRTNTIRGGGTGIFAADAVTSNAVGTTLLLDGNHFQQQTTAHVHLVTQGAGPHVLVGPNNYDYSAPFTIYDGGGTGRVKNAVQNGVTRVFFDTAAPTAGQMPGGDRVGDQVMLLTPAAGIYGHTCIAPGNWKGLPYVA